MTTPPDRITKPSVPTIITATEAARNLSEVLSRVRYRGEHFDVTRGGEAVARLLPPLAPRRVTVRRFFDLLSRQEMPDTDFATELGAGTAPSKERAWAI